MKKVKEKKKNKTAHMGTRWGILMQRYANNSMEVTDRRLFIVEFASRPLYLWKIYLYKLLYP